MPSELVLPHPKAVAREVARRLAEAAVLAVEARDRFVVALAGGSTPRLYHPEVLLRPEIPWARVVVVWGDERGVGPDHPHSNYRMARETLLDLLPRPPLAVLRMEGELDPPEAADRYESALARLFPGEHAPSIDLILLGMGADGHVASLFPGSPALEERERWVAAVPGPGGEGWRLTLTPPVLEAARALLLVGVGKDKAGAYTRAFRGGAQAPALPLERLAAARPDLVVVCDAAAAGSEA